MLCNQNDKDTRAVIIHLACLEEKNTNTVYVDVMCHGIPPKTSEYVGTWLRWTMFRISIFHPTVSPTI